MPTAGTPAADAREARFLAARSARAAERGVAAGRSAPGSSGEGGGAAAGGSTRDRFWRAFRARTSELGGRLDALLGEEGGGGAAAAARFVTAAQRNAGREELESVSDEVRGMRRTCLGHHGGGAATAADPAMGGGAPIDRDALASLPEGDLRLLTEELSRLSSRIDEAREIICPKEVFTFKRYRAAMARREVATEKDANGRRDPLGGGSIPPVGGGEKISFDGNKGGEDEEKKYGIVIADRINCSFFVEADGTVCEGPMNREEDRKASDAVNGLPCPDSATHNVGTSFLVRDLTDCRVLLKGSYRSVHLLNLQSCTIDVAKSINGPMHVTSCHSTTITAASHQLRMHDSSDVQCHIYVTVGPIIEGCIGILFHGDYYNRHPQQKQREAMQENKFRDVKDFNWLRTMVKSPNFDVVESIIESVTPEFSEELTLPAHPVQVGASSISEAPTPTDLIDESSDEDEL